MSDRELVIESERHGRISVDRSRLRSFRKVDPKSAEAIVNGHGLVGWTTLSKHKKLKHWMVNEKGHVTTGVARAEMMTNYDLPTVAGIDIRLSWTRKPGFLLTFVTPHAKSIAKGTVKLETWDNELVLQTLASNGEFEQVMSLAKDAKQVTLRLIWDRQTGEMIVFSKSGEQLGKLGPGDGTGRAH